jgi:hypothetical protein
MENDERMELGQWVEQQIAYLDPPSGWRPDPAAALTRLQSRMDAESQRVAWLRWPAWAAIAGLTMAAFVLLPSGRMVAQQVWQFLTVRQVAFVRVNRWPQGVPSPNVQVQGTLAPPLPARDVDEVRWRVQYDPRLPRPGVLDGNPFLLTTFSVSAGTIIKTADLDLALRKAGVTDEQVPPQWNGAQLTLHTSALVIAQWPDITLVQSLPLTLTAPSGFDFPTFSALILRVLGVGPDEAQRLAQRAGTAPPWLAPIGQDLMEHASVEEIALNSGPATLLQESQRTTVIWSVPDRVYLLSGKLSRELAIAVANAVQ